LQPWITEKLAALTEVTDRDGWVDPLEPSKSLGGTTEALASEPAANPSEKLM
jgi:hypothetical protein